jgi:purine-binding chemotaxis protein CheW
MSGAAEFGGSSSGRYLAFDLGGQCFAVDVSRVEVVLETARITRVPKALPFLRGVINFRGSVIPVADLRTRFGEGRTESDGGSPVIVLQARVGPDDVTVGVLADSVREVIELESAGVERPPQFGFRLDEAIIAGVGQSGGEFVVVLNVDEALKATGSQGDRAPEQR